MLARCVTLTLGMPKQVSLARLSNSVLLCTRATQAQRVPLGVAAKLHTGRALPGFSSTIQRTSQRSLLQQPTFKCAGYTVSTGGETEAEMEPFKLIIYSKDECCLCDGLKEKVAALMEVCQFFPNVLSGAELEVRDITTNDEWLQKYKFEIPVLARANLDGSNEMIIQRPSPRLNAQQLENHLQKAFSKMGV